MLSVSLGYAKKKKKKKGGGGRGQLLAEVSHNVWEGWVGKKGEGEGLQ